MTTRARKSRTSEGKRDGDPPIEWWDDEALPLNLRFELGIVRQVLRRLVALWDAQGDAIESEEARRLAGLIFNGARTSALLLFQQTRGKEKKDDIQAWLDEALKQVGDDFGVEL